MTTIHRATRTPGWPMPEGYVQSPLRWFALGGKTFWIEGGKGGPGSSWTDYQIVRDDGRLVESFTTFAALRSFVNAWDGSD